MTKEQILSTFGGKPSGALQLMLDGLRDESRGFEINMGTFGFRNSIDQCFGCAATCASLKVHQANKESFEIYDSIRWGLSEANKIYDQQKAIKEFECAINDARTGSLYSLFCYCELEYSEMDGDVSFYLHIENWREQIPQVEKVIENLKSKGF